MNKRIAMFTIGAVAIIPLSGAYAQNSNGVRTQKNEEIQQHKEELRLEREELKAKRKENREKWCEQTGVRINTRVNRYENNQAMYQKVFSNMKTRLDRLVANLKEKGADTTQLEADLKTLAEKIAKLDSDYATFIAALKETTTSTCGQSDGEFKKQLGEARSVIPTIKADRQDIKNFFQTTIKKDLQTIRQKLAISDAEAEKKDAETESNSSDKSL